MKLKRSLKYGVLEKFLLIKKCLWVVVFWDATPCCLVMLVPTFWLELDAFILRVEEWNTIYSTLKEEKATSETSVHTQQSGFFLSQKTTLLLCHSSGNKLFGKFFLFQRALIMSSSSGCTTSVIECFGLLNDFFPFMSVLDAVLPIIYFHGIQIIFNIILPPSLGSS